MPAPGAVGRRSQLLGKAAFVVAARGPPGAMRFGNVEIKPLGGGLGCLLMILFSVVASVLLTVVANLLLR